MSELDDMMAEAEYNGLLAEARKHSLTTAMFAIQWAEANFDEWRAWSDARGLTGGPRTADVLHMHGRMIAQLVGEYL